jgi:ribonuclease HII
MTAERARKASIFPHLEFEKRLWSAGMLQVAGLDEAGRGCWAGPVCAAAVILPPQEDVLERLSGVQDSKLMSPTQRAFWAGEIKKNTLTWGVGFASSREIDRKGIVPATRLAMRRALEKCGIHPQYLLLDYLLLPGVDVPQTALVHGDAQSLSIAAASVLAKTTRDARLLAMDGKYPGYGFGQHKGYGTARHRQALREFGVSPIHRLSFRPARDL